MKDGGKVGRTQSTAFDSKTEEPRLQQTGAEV